MAITRQINLNDHTYLKNAAYDLNALIESNKAGFLLGPRRAGSIFYISIEHLERLINPLSTLTQKVIIHLKKIDSLFDESKLLGYNDFTWRKDDLIKHRKAALQDALTTMCLLISNLKSEYLQQEGSSKLINICLSTLNNISACLDQPITYDILTKHFHKPPEYCYDQGYVGENCYANRNHELDYIHRVVNIILECEKIHTDTYYKNLFPELRSNNTSRLFKSNKATTHVSASDSVPLEIFEHHIIPCLRSTKQEILKRTYIPGFPLCLSQQLQTQLNEFIEVTYNELIADIFEFTEYIEIYCQKLKASALHIHFGPQQKVFVEKINRIFVLAGVGNLSIDVDLLQGKNHHEICDVLREKLQLIDRLRYDMPNVISIAESKPAEPETVAPRMR